MAGVAESKKKVLRGGTSYKLGVPTTMCGGLLLRHAFSRPKTIRFKTANREELQLRCPLYSGHRNLVPPASVFSACFKNARKEALGPSSTWVTAKRRGGTSEGTVVGKHRPQAAAWGITAAAQPYWSITRPRTNLATIRVAPLLHTKGRTGLRSGLAWPTDGCTEQADGLDRWTCRRTTDDVDCDDDHDYEGNSDDTMPFGCRKMGRWHLTLGRWNPPLGRWTRLAAEKWGAGTSPRLGHHWGAGIVWLQKSGALEPPPVWGFKNIKG